MKRFALALTLVLALLPSAAHAQQKKILSGKLVVAGLVTALAGVLISVPAGQTYNVLGDGYCVTDYSVNAGACSVSLRQKQVGAWFIGAGLGMAGIGVIKVDVKPDRRGVAVSRSVKW